MVDFMSIYLAFSRSIPEFILIECIRWKTEIKKETKESLVRTGHRFWFELKLQLSEKCVLYWNCVLNSKQSRNMLIVTHTHTFSARRTGIRRQTVMFWSCSNICDISNSIHLIVSILKSTFRFIAQLHDCTHSVNKEKKEARKR